MKKERIKINNEYKKLISISLRYLILLGLMFSLPIIYKILMPLTVDLVAVLLKLFYNIKVMNNFIIINDKYLIEIISSCITGSAYLLLLILNLTIPMKKKQRIYSIVFSVSLLFVLNVLRIIFLSVLIANDFEFFDLAHKLFWYLISTLFVVIIWLLTIKVYNIRQIPAYSDIKYLMKNIKKKQ